MIRPSLAGTGKICNWQQNKGGGMINAADEAAAPQLNNIQKKTGDRSQDQAGPGG
jgi:hypothetical protein